jgi:lipoprotein-releasing system permease protein
MGSGVMALVVGHALMRGVEGGLMEVWSGVTPHVTLRSVDVRVYDKLIKILSNNAEVRVFYPVMTQPVGIVSQNRSQAAVLKVVEEGSFTRLPVVRRIVQGEPKSFQGLVVGRGLAASLGMGVGESVWVVRGRPEGKVALSKMTVAAIFETGVWEIDHGIVYAPGQPTGVIDVEVFLKNPLRARELAGSIGSGSLYVETWEDRYRILSILLKIQNIMLRMYLSLLYVEATFWVGSHMVLEVARRRRHLSVLIAMGAPREEIARMLLYYGSLLGVLAIGIGMISGIGVSHVLDRYRWIRIPDAYFLSYIPFKIVNIDLLTIVVFSVSMLAAVVAWAAVSVTRRIGPHVEIN